MKIDVYGEVCNQIPMSKITITAMIYMDANIYLR
jgi:hypothetical protein